MTTESDEFALVADIGGTHCRFALSPVDAPALDNIVSRRCAQYANLKQALEDYLASLDDGQTVVAFCLAVPGPAHTDSVRLVNNPWRSLDAGALRREFSRPVHLLNDFAAQALSLPVLEAKDLEHWQAGNPDPGCLTRAVIGPGTGLGSALLTANNEVVATEAGHMSFAPATAGQRRLLECLSTVLPRVFNEALASGPGLANIHRGLSLLQDRDIRLSAEQISQRAGDGDSDCRTSIEEFSRILGGICGDLALAYGAVGGLFLSGGLLTALGDLFARDAFLESFSAKGSYRDYCRAIPIARITHPYPGLLGAANSLRLQAH